jgi:hypothetical protein
LTTSLGLGGNLTSERCLALNPSRVEPLVTVRMCGWMYGPVPPNQSQNSIVPSSKDLKDISKVIVQENQWSVSNIQKEYDEVITDKNEEISHLKDHSKKLLTQIK